MNKIIGVSCYNRLALAKKAQAYGADYIAFGAVLLLKPNPKRQKRRLSLFLRASKRGWSRCNCSN
jgi:thiamine-phosphate pyrophosphorylase